MNAPIITREIYPYTSQFSIPYFEYITTSRLQSINYHYHWGGCILYINILTRMARLNNIMMDSITNVDEKKQAAAVMIK